MENSKSSGPVTHPGLRCQTSRFPDQGETRQCKLRSELFEPSTTQTYVYCSSPGLVHVQVTVQLQTTNRPFSFQMRRWHLSSRILWWMKLFRLSMTDPALPGPPAGMTQKINVHGVKTVKLLVDGWEQLYDHSDRFYQPCHSFAWNRSSVVFFKSSQMAFDILFSNIMKQPPTPFISLY